MTKGNRTNRRGRGMPKLYTERVEVRTTADSLQAWQKEADRRGEALGAWLRDVADRASGFEPVVK